MDISLENKTQTSAMDVTTEKTDLSEINKQNLDSKDKIMNGSPPQKSGSHIASQNFDWAFDSTSRMKQFEDIKGITPVDSLKSPTNFETDDNNNNINTKLKTASTKPVEGNQNTDTKTGFIQIDSEKHSKSIDSQLETEHEEMVDKNHLNGGINAKIESHRDDINVLGKDETRANNTSIQNRGNQNAEMMKEKENKSLLVNGKIIQDGVTTESLSMSKSVSGEKRNFEETPFESNQESEKKMKQLETAPTETIGNSNKPPITIDLDPQHSITVDSKPMPRTSNETIEPTLSSDKIETIPDISKIDESTNKLSNRSLEKEKELDQNFTSLVTLDTIPEVEYLPPLSAREFAELELALQIGDKFTHGEDNYWREDWVGNLQLIDKDLLMNKDKMVQRPGTKPVLLPFCEWVTKTSQNANDFRAIRLLFSHISGIRGTPDMAKKIMAYSLKRPASTVEERLKYINQAVRRISYDPDVLWQDGWTTTKSDSPEGASGGSYLIGRRVIWHRYEAIIIAFVKDDEIGDLWKAMWVEDQETFDLEADELQDALTKWDKKNSSKQKKLLANRSAKASNSSNKALSKPVGSARFEATRNFTVDGIENGIILATSYSARNGVPWPARVMHSSEVKALGAQVSSRRSSSKNEIHVVFLAPYWNGQYSQSFRNRGSSTNLNNEATNVFSTGDLLELETIDVSENTIHKYPFDDIDGTISIDKIRSAFSFLCLPKAAFSRFLDSHRLALAFKVFAKRNLSVSSNSVQSNSSRADAFASLNDCHPLAIQTYLFPSVILNLPYTYLLSQLPHPNEIVSKLVGDGEEMTEPILQLHIMLKAMTPPLCWGEALSQSTKDIITKKRNESTIPSTPLSKRRLTPIKSPSVVESNTTNTKQDIFDEDKWALSNFASEYLMNIIGGLSDSKETENVSLPVLGNRMRDLLSRFRNDFKIMTSSDDDEDKKEYLRSILLFCMSTKGHGEDVLSSSKISDEINLRNVTIEWRKACERIFKFGTKFMATPSSGNGVTSVITDSRCNQHLTAVGSYERAVRVPAAIRGAKMAGAGSDENLPLITQVDDKYMDLAERKFLPMTHKSTYLKRMKRKIAALPPDARGAPLTDDSEGEGGEDTVGSRGSYTAAVAAVAAAIQSVDMIISGQIANAFCAVRPPGHHAGRELHAMDAISNGFCLLNAAACAAIYATTPQSDGGLGLKRVCVIDFDVHHGNGTQDILCSTHDPRFLYVSTHAGGAHINGFDDEDSDDAYRRSHGYSRCEGIFPGRCGDTSPHGGVLNIPLGMKVTAQAIGNALVSRVAPAVEAYSPDLIIISAGFDAHRNDPLGMGGLTAEDFGSVTSVICHMALKSCSGRVVSILEGGYGVPCCQPPQDLFLPKNLTSSQGNTIRLGNDFPEGMEDKVDPTLSQKLEKCNQEGFIECVKEHVQCLSKYNNRSK